MAGGPHFIWIPLVLSCVCQASDNRRVHQDVSTVIRTGNPVVDRIISQITLPEGIDPKNINVTSVVVRTCSGMKEQLSLLNRQLQLTTVRNNQLDIESSALKREVRLLKVQLTACSSTASAITGSYQTQLHKKMKQLLETFDSDAFLILKIIALTREVNTLQKKVKQAANSTESTADIQELQSKLQEKTTELNVKRQEIERSHTNSSLILQIILLQNQIWDLEQVKSRGGETTVQLDKKSLALQKQLDEMISQLRGKGDAGSAMLELISVHSKITMIQRLITVHIEESRTSSADYQRQWRLKIELLKRKISQLNRDENNMELTQEIIKLQSEVDHLRQLMSNAKKTTDTQLRELRVILEGEKRQQENLQKQLEEAEYAQAQLIMRVIGIMKEVRELQADEQDQTTSSSQATTLQTLFQNKEREYAKAQAEINELQRKLRLKTEECSGFEERHEQVKTEYEQKIAELNRSGDSGMAVILNVMNLHDELRTLKELISTTDDPARILDLKRQLEEKQDELFSKTADIERLIANPKIILTIIELQNEIRELQKTASNDTTSGHIKELQNRMDGLISEIDVKGNENTNTKQMLKMLSLQSQVEQLQRQLSDLQMLKATQVTQLRHDLTTKRNELQQYVDELKEKNQTNARLILTVTNLHNQLRTLENERHSDNTTSSLTITQLREQLKAKMEEHIHDQAEIQILQTQLKAKVRESESAQAEVRELQKNLRLKNQECSGLEERHEQVKTELEQKIADLSRTGESKAALILKVMKLHDELKTQRELISTTDNPDKISELRRQLELKQGELNARSEDIERLIPNPKIILTIIELQDEIWDLQKKAANETNSDQVKELQNRVNGLITEMDDSDNTKLILKIITLQSQVEQLQRQLSDLQMLQTTQVTQFRNDLTTKKKELQIYVNQLNEKNQTNARLILTITDLQNQLRNLEQEKHKESQTTSATVTKMKEQLKEKQEEHARDRAQIEALQIQLNQTESQCSNFEQKLKDLQTDLDTKMNDLQSKSDTVTSLALQVSTLTLQLEELKRQLQNTESETKIKELQKLLDEKTIELDKKKEELKARSAQPQRLLQIITIQTEIEKLVTVATNETDYNKIRALEDHLNYLIDGIQDESNENTKLMFKILTQQDEIARLKKQEERQTQAELGKIRDLENELEDVRNQIKDKTLLLDSSDKRIANLSAQIMELHKQIKPLEDKISYLKEANTENLEELQKRLELSKRQLQDSELRLKDADATNFNSIMEIADLRAKLKKAQKMASRAAKQDFTALEEQIQTQQRETKKLENANKDLQQEVKELKMCCSDANTGCDDLQSQLQESLDHVDHLQQQLLEKDVNLKQLQDECSNFEGQQQQTLENADYLQQQLNEKDARLDQLQQELEAQMRENNRLQEDNHNLQNKLTDVEDKTIYTSKMTLDPNTANPRILLSADNSQMSPSATAQNVPDYPGRFDVALAVLSKTGFSAGRHYWEVFVAGNLCYHLGMASESAQRKGVITFSPENGFWTIVLNKQGQYRAIDRRPSIIQIQTQPQTLGILLDYKNGEISFYDAGARAHMYSFRGQRFTDKIYAFINFCVEDAASQTPIVLLPPGSADWIK